MPNLSKLNSKFDLGNAEFIKIKYQIWNLILINLAFLTWSKLSLILVAYLSEFFSVKKEAM